MKDYVQDVSIKNYFINITCMSFGIITSLSQAFSLVLEYLHHIRRMAGYTGRLHFLTLIKSSQLDLNQVSSLRSKYVLRPYFCTQDFRSANWLSESSVKKWSHRLRSHTTATWRSVALKWVSCEQLSVKQPFITLDVHVYSLQYKHNTKYKKKYE